jgi:hypothetical protein
MNIISEIVGAWITSFNPDENEKKLAENRYSICFTCPNRVKKLGIEVCNKCGCPLSKKIFTQKLNDSCPLGKWDEVDAQFQKTKHNSSKFKLF